MMLLLFLRDLLSLSVTDSIAGLSFFVLCDDLIFFLQSKSISGACIRNQRWQLCISANKHLSIYVVFKKTNKDFKIISLKTN